MAKKYKKSEVVEMLSAMERKAKQVLAMVSDVEQEATKNSFSMYDEFVKRASDFDTLAILVESRIKNMEIGAGSAGELQDQYDKLKIIVAHGQIKASMKFFFVLSAATNLPLGARNLFVTELRRLYHLREELSKPKFQDMMGDDAINDLATAELILQEIIDRAPSLLDFTSG